MTASKISPEAKDLLMWIGTVLVEIQLTESVIRSVLTWVFPKTDLPVRLKQGGLLCS
jgi:hypothetical protein